MGKLLIENVGSFLENDNLQGVPDKKEGKKDFPKKKKPGKDNTGGEGHSLDSEEQKKLLPLALKWLKNRFGDGFNFKHNPKLNVPNMKSYNVSVDNKEFILSGRGFDTSEDGKVDTVLFRIDTIEEPEETEKPFGDE